jgi:hypothetical protein
MIMANEILGPGTSWAAVALELELEPEPEPVGEHRNKVI